MRVITAFLLAVALAGCRTVPDPSPAIVMPGAPGQETRVITAAEASDLSKVQAIAADVMQQWLTARGQEAPDEHAHHMGPVPMMPGMLTPEVMEQLAAAKGVEFDRLFLNSMIRHHLGAIQMVDDLLATPGAAQETDVFAFTSDVVADQQAEMDRMAQMLARLDGGR
jgi:uncharacterized protein (DUF305 family)